MMELEKDTWYWMSHPHEGDVFYPVIVVDDEHVMMDGQHYRICYMGGVRFTKAVMPEAI